MSAGGLANVWVRAAWGAALLAAPARVLVRVHGPTDRRAVLLCRVLGVRQLAQAGARLAVGPGFSRLGTLIDASHALSCGAGAMVSGPWRAPALADGVIASAFTVLDRREASGVARG